MPRETWYILEDGSVADPNEVAPGSDGVLRHKSGIAVAMRRHDCPSSRSLDADAERAKSKTRDMKPEQPKRGYKTRETKVD